MKQLTGKTLPIILAVLIGAAAIAFGFIAAGNAGANKHEYAEGEEDIEAIEAIDQAAEDIAHEHEREDGIPTVTFAAVLDMNNISDRFLVKATEEQKAELEAYAHYDFLGGQSWSVGYKRKMLQLLGELPEDAPRITLEQATRILNSIDMREYEDQETEWIFIVSREFNKITGAPDWEGGSGMLRMCYFLDDEPMSYIMLYPSSARLFDAESGTSQIIYQEP